MEEQTNWNYENNFENIIKIILFEKEERNSEQ